MLYVYPTELPTPGTEVFTFDSCQDEERAAPAKATTYPMDVGFTATDGVSIEGERLKWSGTVTATPLGMLLGIPWDMPVGIARPGRAVDELIRLRNLRQPVMLAGRFWSKVCYLTSVQAKAGATVGNALEVSVEAEEVRRALPAFGSVPASRQAPAVQPQAAKEEAGGGSGRGKSWDASLVDGLGSLGKIIRGK